MRNELGDWTPAFGDQDGFTVRSAMDEFAEPCL
jgi:hypothetical protein